MLKRKRAFDPSSSERRAGGGVGIVRPLPLSARPAGSLREGLRRLNRNRELFALGALLTLSTVAALLSPHFLTATNLKNVLAHVSVLAALTAGEALVMLTGGIDLSVASVLALSGVVTGILVKLWAWPVALGMVGGVLTGAACGLVNGLLVTKVRIPSFIATLAMMAIARGLTLILTGGRSISNFPEGFLVLAGFLGPLPVLIVVVLGVYALLQGMLGNTRLGQHIYAIGGNEEAARLVGIPADRVKLIVFTLSGACAGLGGVLLSARLNSAYPNAALGMELDAIAASVLGGVSFTGGVGSLVGAFLGALVITVLGNLLNLLNVSAFYQFVAKGLILILAAISLARGVKFAK